MDSFARHRLTPADFVPVLEYDGEVALGEVDESFWETLKKLEPFGSGNPTPVFVARQAKLVQPPRILKDKHVKLKMVAAVKDGQWQKAHGAIGWRMAERSAKESLVLGDILDVAFSVDYNDHPDFGGLQLTLQDFARIGTEVAVADATGR